MFQRTTNYNFQKYGTVLSESKDTEGLESTFYKVKTKTAERFFKYEDSVYLECSSGIAMLVILKEEGIFQYDTYVLHRTVQMHPNISFAVISLSSNCRIQQFQPKGTSYTKIDVPEDYLYEHERAIPRVLTEEILSCFYQVRSSDYVFPGESHEYWELTFIDSGQMISTVDGESYTLNPYDFIIYGPGQFHTQETVDSSCSYFTTLFEMKIPFPELLLNRVYKAHRELNDVFTRLIKASQTNKLYNEELVLCHLKEVIINVLQYDFNTNVPVASSPTQQHVENELLEEILMYIDTNVFEPLFIEDLCNKFSLSRSTLQKLFKYNLNIAPKQYISNLKLEKSKVLIQENKYLMSEIAEMLGFGSIHYFSKKFKQTYEISPTNYAKTVIK